MYTLYSENVIMVPLPSGLSFLKVLPSFQEVKRLQREGTLVQGVAR